MATALLRKRDSGKQIEYPTSDGKPMAETDLHRNVMIALIKVLETWFAKKPMVYVSGNMLVFYVRGDKRKHVSPDVFVVAGVPKHIRDYFLCWEEGKSPTLVIEVTSKTTKKEDLDKKWHLYRDVLKVKEYFLFDPRSEYLKPRFQGFRLRKGEYVPIPMIDGRMVSKVLGLHLEPDGYDLRLYDPESGQWLPTPEERVEQLEREVERLRQETRRLNGDLEQQENA
ncbi:MAG: Uma2 family endonuclease [Planctomycetes bacterium]|nr:Uma2 family endonuclease [Planctomycetota bacterium]